MSWRIKWISIEFVDFLIISFVSEFSYIEDGTDGIDRMILVDLL